MSSLGNISDSDDKRYEANLAKKRAEAEALLREQKQKEWLERQVRKEAKLAEQKRLEEEIWRKQEKEMSQTSFGHISINSSSILMVSMATKIPWKDLLINTSHVSRQSIMAKILGRSTSNHHGTVY